MKSLLVAAAVAATAVAAPASAAETFVFTGGPNSATGGTADGNSKTWTTGTGANQVTARVTAFTITTGNILQAAEVGWWSSAGLGVLAASEGSGGGNSHTVDNVGGYDFLVFQFNRPVEALLASAQVYAQGSANDNDFAVRFGTTGQSYLTNFTAAQIATVSGWTALSPIQYRDNNGTTTAIDINQNNLTGNLLFIGAGGSDLAKNDSFKLRSLSVNLSPVPEPATWAMMIAGFGLVGAGMRRRSGVTATRVTA